MFALDTDDFAHIVREYDLAPFRLKQIREWIFGKYADDFRQMTNLPGALRTELAARYQVTESRIAAHRKTGDGTVKLLVRYPDGAAVEAVLMEYRNWTSACLSTQVGCAMGCTFCATGPLGFVRNLSWPELAEELWHCHWFAARHGLKPLRNMVLMGIGEPLANLDNVVKLVETASSPEFFNMGQRRIAISTVGLIPEIYKLARCKLAITLAVSLHAPNDALRNKLMPVTARYPLQDLLDACRNYTVMTGRRITFEYLLIDGVNDSSEHARELADLLKGFNCLVNLIQLNRVPGTAWRPSTRTDVFKKELEQRGINVTVRRSLGAEIDAACGQLRRGTLQA
ncbi:MAG TPA: 23S rRNA (adenine(2503)-C(2))-methyltransferase RlmN [Bacillota bacterium]|nr:23S rRNA (adenine(2503)-C(2))-methyltransferase RlmN [Bacillota bacterium]HPZ89861.1 23S rRNA (adenine(2503)-C(2))-methyltransferase RlmN [Bacillota bacterium]HQE01123.1 23S rRNA (adenine(2503)-C(2))-methyltransferase RlmN [Bacillota bacterium]